MGGRAAVGLALALSIAVALSACAGAPAAPDAGPPRRTDAGPRCGWDEVDAGAAGADPDGPGRYAVGVRTIALTDPARDRVLPVEVWYPVPRDGEPGLPNAYDLDTPIGRLASACTGARRDAAAAPGAWPTVIFSHGFGGIRFQSFFLTEHLASHGFVVVAPDHPGNTIADLAMLGDDAVAAQSAIDRPLDVLFVLARIDAGDLASIAGIDRDRIAISGHSFGGWTSIEAARREPRLRVVVALAPGFREPSSPMIAGELARPLLLFGGSVDRTTPFDTSQQAAYDLALPPRALVRVEGAGHMDFTDVCSMDAVRAIFDDGCDPESLDPAIARSRARVIALAFLRRWLLLDRSADALLEPGAVTALGDLTYAYEAGP